MNFPSSSKTVTVWIIDTTSHIIVPNHFADPLIKGAELLNCPSFSFLIEHGNSGRRLLFDLGLRPDFQNLPPVIQHWFEENDAKLSVAKGVSQILEEADISTESVEAIIWSHWHFDHIGDPSTFPSSTNLIVGPGFKDIFIPGYPANPGAPILESDYEGREVNELDFKDDHAVKIGNFDAIDYFGDGSFYILDGPGHTVGHVCAIARTTSTPSSFILMGADACHHSSEMRPSQWLPLPSEIYPHPLEPSLSQPCPGSLFGHLLRDGDRRLSICGQKRPGMLLGDPDVAEKTIEKLQLADAESNIFVVIAHDSHLKDTVDFFPLAANGFLAKGWATCVKWKFLADFKEALLGIDKYYDKKPENI